MEQCKVLIKGKLTKKFFMELPEGLYLASNLLKYPYRSSFAEKIASLDEREQQWRRIVNAGVSQKLCRAFKNRKHYRTWHIVKYVIDYARASNIC